MGDFPATHPVRRSTYLWVVHTDEREEKDGETERPSILHPYICHGESNSTRYTAEATTITIAVAVLHEERLCKGISRRERKEGRCIGIGGFKGRKEEGIDRGREGGREEGSDGDFGNEWPDKLAQ